jgi:hypothetical protein
LRAILSIQFKYLCTRFVLKQLVKRQHP